MTTVVHMIFGSKLYGTDTPDSDNDFKGVHIPYSKDILLQRAPASVSKNEVKNGEGIKNRPGQDDTESYSLQRFFELLSKGETHVLDMLFARDEALIEVSPIWREIQAHTDLLVTRKSERFVDYCHRQANKYGIKGSRVAAARDAATLFKRFWELMGDQAKVNDISTSLSSIVGEHNCIVYQSINSSGDKGYFFECCNRKVAFNNTIKAAYQMCQKIYDSYGTRARLAETNEGIDWKALSHAIRISDEAVELLDTGKITHPVKERNLILDIKTGKLPYAEVANYIEERLLAVVKASNRSTLREEIDHDFIEYMIHKTYSDKVVNSHKRVRQTW